MSVHSVFGKIGPSSVIYGVTNVVCYLFSTTLIWNVTQKSTFECQHYRYLRKTVDKLYIIYNLEIYASIHASQVALASGDKYLEKVREAQLSINIENVVCVDAKGLQLSDPFHLTTEAQVQLGSLLAQAYLSHFGTNVVI